MKKLLIGAALLVAVIITGCAPTPVVTTNANGSFSTNYVANAQATQFAAGAQTAAPVIGAAVPAPYGAAVGLGVGLIGIIVGAFSKFQANKANATANLHQSTLQAVVTGIENAVPDIQTALTTVSTSGVLPAQTAASITTANNILSAVKASITSATTANGTAANLNATLAKSGIGPTA